MAEKFHQPKGMDIENIQSKAIKIDTSLVKLTSENEGQKQCTCWRCTKSNKVTT